MSPWILINVVCMFVSLWVAFGKTFRPIAWGTFYFNIGAAVINAVGILHHFYRWIAS